MRSNRTDQFIGRVIIPREVAAKPWQRGGSGIHPDEIGQCRVVDAITEDFLPHDPARRLQLVDPESGEHVGFVYDIGAGAQYDVARTTRFIETVGLA